MNKTEQKITIQEHLKINGVVFHTFSPDGKYVAVSLKSDPLIEIYQIEDLNSISKWKLVWRLKEQSQQISQLDWSVNNQILSTSYDRSTIIWDLAKQTNKWQKNLVIMDSSRAILCGKWSKNGKKFIVGGGDHKSFIGYFDEENDFWQSMKLSGFKSSVTNVEFHPSGRVALAGSTDNSISLSTCYVEDKYEDLQYSGQFASIKTYNETLLNISDTEGWIEGIAFSPSGNRFCFSVHNGTVQYATVKGDEVEMGKKKVQVKKLPLKKLVYLNEDTVVAGGYDSVPSVLKYQGDGELKFQKFVDSSMTEGSDKQDSKIKQLQTQMFQTSHGKKTGGSHTTPILSISAYQQNKGNSNTFASSDINGSILFWEA